MSHNAFQEKLEELRQQVGSIQQFSLEDPAQLRELLPVVLAGLQKSLTELLPFVAELAPGNGEAAQADGNHREDPRLARARRFRAMAEWSPVLVRIMGGESRCRWANRSWNEFTGLSRSELLGDRWLARVHPDDRARCRQVCSEALESNSAYRIGYRLERSGGEYGWLLEVGTPRVNGLANLGGHLGVATEITEHKQVGAQLKVQYVLAHILANAHSLEDVGVPLLRSLCADLGWELGELWLADGEDRPPRLAHVWAGPGIDASPLESGLRTRRMPTRKGSDWRDPAPDWIADIALDEQLAAEPEAASLGLHAMFRLPILVQGKPLGILRVFALASRPEDRSMVEFMVSAGLQIGQFLERQIGLESTRQSEARKSAILEASLDAVLSIDGAGRLVEFNAAAERLFGLARVQALGQVFTLLVPPRLHEQAGAAFAAYLKSGASEFFGQRHDARALRDNGVEFPAEVVVAPIGSGNPPMLTVFLRDNTARVEAEAEVRQYQVRLRALMADLLLAEERERRRLAMDLHDGLSQTIALTQIKLSALRTSLDGKLTSPLDEIQGLIDQTNRTARSISFELSPSVLHDLGLGPALHWLVENIHTRYGIEIELHDDGQPKQADERTRVILFRSIRELLINAAKHAQAKRIQVRLQLEGGSLIAAIEDDGVGMRSKGNAAFGSGLLSIRERLNHVGGSMQLDSAPGQGTRVVLRAPLEYHEAKIA